MAYTQEDLDNLDQAIIKFGLGKRKGLITIGDHTTRFADVTLKELQDLRGIIATAVSPAYARRTYAKNGGRG